jgi:thiol-disulfide isomerase/thioredoxin
MQVEDISEFQELNLQSLDRTFIPDSSGKFFVSFLLSRPNYFRIGRNVMYLSPGDSMSVVLDFKAPDKAIFKGNRLSNIAANEYLESTPFPKEGSFLEGGKNIMPTIQSSIDTVLAMALRKQQQLDKYKHLNREFKRLENVRLKADIVNSLLYIKTYYYWKYKIPKDSLTIFLKEADKILKPYVFKYLQNQIDPEFLKLTVYRNLISLVLDSVENTAKVSTIRDYLKAWNLVDKVKKRTSKADISMLFSEVESINNPNYKFSVAGTFDKLLSLNNGDSAVDFKIRDINGQEVSLKSYKGKVIYIDIWATWCGPCLEELPYLDSLRDHFKNEKQIQFITLSIDDDIIKWKEYLNKKKMETDQWIIDRELLKAYSVITIPRVIILDKDFNIAAMIGESPSSKRVKKILDDLVAKPAK